MFYNESVDPVRDKLNCNSTLVDSGGVDLDFGKKVEELVDGIADSAAVGGGHMAAEVRGVFGLAECWKTVSVEGCKACLGKASREVKACLPSKEGRALNAGCYLRYSTQKFFSNPADEKRHGSGEFDSSFRVLRKYNWCAILGSVFSSCSFMALITIMLYFLPPGCWMLVVSVLGKLMCVNKGIRIFMFFSHKM